ncbi:phage PhiH1 repressor protein [Halomicrobium mukohataei DSM 12286]|uniref:Phage PhiH1 repressor protein n=2 Tax=Halomicrobium mukohataei TaxID=57705 RepID=C7NWF4_HALMD|nr:phage PhiH1 repressor protein [Halomicrobium mukohataei DSM 12286]
MHRRVEWLKPSDRVIVAELAEYGGWMKPSSLALNISYTRRHIARRCQVLAKHGLLERHDETAGYRVTEHGHQFLQDKLNEDDL